MPEKVEFVRDALPSNWLEYAEELEEAAEALWQDRDSGVRMDLRQENSDCAKLTKACAHSRSYVLVAALSLENVIKGLIVSEHPECINTGTLDKRLKTHSLLDLVKMVAGLELDVSEVNVCEVCQDAMPYWGRYPIPLRYNGLRPEVVVNEQFRDRFRSLHFRLCKALYDKVKNGWDSGAGARVGKMRSRRYGDRIDLGESLT